MSDAGGTGESAELHRAKMQRQKQRMDARIASADEDRGVLLVLTGSGKGKSSSAFGMMLRALGHDMRIGVVQFIKSKHEVFFRRFPEVRFYVTGEGFTWETQDRERDIRAAGAAWEIALSMLRDPNMDFIVLDELNIALKHGYVAISQVIEAVKTRPPRQHVVITGRAAPAELIEVADTVTDMRVVKHAFHAGVRAQKGIEL
jgi:cob(I)alamin adenosyltransferase